MTPKQAIKKITFNMSVITNILLGGVVLTGNYKLDTKNVVLTAACLASNYVYVKTKSKNL